MRCWIRLFQYLFVLVILALPPVAWGAATGWVRIDSPADDYKASSDFSVNISYTVTQDDNFCANDIFKNWATFFVKLDGRIIHWLVFNSCCGVSPFGNVQSYGAYIGIGGLDPNISHTVTAYLEDQVYVYGSGCTSGDIFAQDTLTFRVCRDADGDKYTNCAGDCNDNDPAVYPGAPEICDNKDNDCDGQIDEGLSADADGDGHYTAGSCKIPHDDCNDNDASIYPGAPELCDGKDNDCDGQIDTPCCLDSDGDGISACLDCDDNDPNNRKMTPDTDNDGYSGCVDCNNSDPLIHPEALELCDGKDNNCDHQIDEGCCVDVDDDGFKNCERDCDDNDNTIYPGAFEVCDGKDNNCNGIVDELCGPCGGNPCCGDVCCDGQMGNTGF